MSTHALFPRFLCRLLLTLACAGVAPASAESVDWTALRDGTIILIRHAIAPGFGDPAHFSLADCSTQRNIDTEGRAQARRIGEQFRAREIRVTRVLSSQWCRCRDTATLAFQRAPEVNPAFNSFFGHPERATEHTRAALDALASWQGPGVMAVVTHQVNITALTGITPAPGEGVVVRLQRKHLEILGRLRF